MTPGGLQEKCPVLGRCTRGQKDEANTPMKRSDMIPALCWVGAGVGVGIHAWSLGLGRLSNPGPGMMPFLLGLILVLCALPVLLGAFFWAEPSKPGTESMWSGIRFRKIIIVLGSLSAYAFILEKIGYVLAGFLVLVALFKTVDSQKWTSVLLMSTITIFLTYILFAVILEVELPPGLLRF